MKTNINCNERTTFFTNTQFSKEKLFLSDNKMTRKVFFFNLSFFYRMSCISALCMVLALSSFAASTESKVYLFN